MKLVRTHFTTIGSTNTWAKANAHVFDRASLTIVTADEQTAGRGRFQRQWISPAKQNIYATYCFFVPSQRDDIGNIPQVLAISAAQILETLSISAKIKWPNDVIISGKKIAGILCETTQVENALCIILGIGININMPIEILQQIDRPATSLLAETNQPHDIETILNNLTSHFTTHLQTFLNDSFTPFYGQYTHHLAHKVGAPLRLQDGATYTECTFHSISPDGSLNVVTPSGTIQNHRTGELLYPIVA